MEELSTISFLTVMALTTIIAMIIILIIVFSTPEKKELEMTIKKVNKPFVVAPIKRGQSNGSRPWTYEESVLVCFAAIYVKKSKIETLCRFLGDGIDRNHISLQVRISKLKSCNRYSNGSTKLDLLTFTEIMSQGTDEATMGFIRTVMDLSLSKDFNAWDFID
jgi:hypothetical protein